MQKFPNRGSALISALFIMTLVAIAATAMSLRLQSDIHRTRLTIENDKLYLASQFVTFWAMSTLLNPKVPIKALDKTGKILNFPDKLQSIYPDVHTRGSIYDLHARFNINNVSDKRFQQSFVQLLKKKTRVTQNARKELTNNLRNWLTPYQPGANSTLNLDYYLKQKPPYFPAMQLMENVSELRLVKGFSPSVYSALEAELCALPELTAINLNTASKAVLATLGAGLTDYQVDEIVALRGEEGITELGKINPVLEKLGIRNEQITLESLYYLVVTDVSTQALTRRKYSVLKRQKDNKGKITLSLIHESLNTY
ncbi:MAG: type II secretion system minor pseudopilin GspK [Tatlockia sp.]|jgi:general secretion pathway protein K